MKKGTKLGLGAIGLLLGTVVLSSCTSSFCNNIDKAHMLYLFDYGVTTYYDTEVEGSKQLVLSIDGSDVTTNVYAKVSFEDAYGINKVNDAALKAASGKPTLSVPTLNYWFEMDKTILAEAIKEAGITDVTTLTADKITRGWAEGYVEKEKGILDEYGYLKFYDTKDEEHVGKKMWANWSYFDQQIRNSGKVSIDECPSSDYIKLYQQTLNGFVANFRSCLATVGHSGDYGNYGPHNAPAEISEKTWASAFSKTSFLWLEGILVWPMGAFVDVVGDGLTKGHVASGWSQLLAILIITVIVRSIMLLVTWKQSASSAKMNELQPQIAKIQAKYPNANTNNYEKQRQASEMAELYKKNKINPLGSILIIFIQFPVFICVWAALQGSAFLSSGSLFGLNFSASISSMLFNAEAWKTGGAVTALILFLLMAGSQVVQMLLPQWIQKSKAKKVARLGKNPAKQSQDNKMKWFTYIMCAFIIIMGFSLASGMGVYWFIGALFSIAQTLIMNKVNERKARNKK